MTFLTTAEKTALSELGVLFKTLRLKNFFSFGNLWSEVELDTIGTTLLVGENLDSGGSSGAGKSTIINAISYCLFDKIPSAVSKDKLINRTNDKKNTLMEVQVFFTKGQHEYQVRRYRGSQTGVQLLQRAVGDETWDTAVDLTPANVNRGEDNFNAKIEEVLGFSYNLFSQIILFNGNSKPFLDLSVGQQRELLEELLRITTLSKKANALKKLISELEKTIALQTQKIEHQKKQNETHARHIREAEERVLRWNQVHQTELLKLTESLTTLSNVDFDSEEALHGEITSLKTDIADLQSKIREETSVFDTKLRELQTKKTTREREAAPEQAKLSLLLKDKVAREREVAPEQAKLTLILREIETTRKEYSELEKELVHLNQAKCPYCLQQYADAGAKIVDLHQKLAEVFNVDVENEKTKVLLEEAIKTFKQKQTEDGVTIEGEIIALEEAIKTFKQKQTEDGVTLDEEIKVLQATKTQSVHAQPLQEKQTTLAELQSALTYRDLASLMKAKSDLEAQADRLEKLEAETNPHFEALEALKKEGEVQVEVDVLDQLNKYQSHQQFLLKLLTDKNSFIRKNIISQTIPFLNKRIGYYTEKLNLPHTVMFQPDMTCEITEIGRDLDHGNLSNGEKKKLNLSLCLAFRDVLTYLHSKVNVLFTDEIDGGSISGYDVDSLISMLKSKAWDDGVSIFIISHRPEFDGRCDKNLVIRKENGFSQLIEQPDA